MNTFKNILMWIWQIPQHIAATFFIFFLIYIKRNKTVKKASISDFTFTLKNEVYSDIKKNKLMVYSLDNLYDSCVTLGKYIIGTEKKILERDQVLYHEYGHTLQSRRLGPIYLIIIGLPSFIGNIVHRICVKKNKPYNYYKMPWEKWANELGRSSLFTRSK